MQLNRNLTKIGISLSLCLSSSYANAQTKKNEPKPDKTLKVSALILTEGVKDYSNTVEQFHEQFKFLNNGLPSNLRKGGNVGSSTDLDSLTSNDDLQTEAIRRLCFPSSGDSPARPKIIGPIAAFLAPHLIGLFVKEVDKGLEKEIAKYSTTHSKKVSIRPYAEDADDIDLRVRSSCFRYSRFTEKQYITPQSNGTSLIESKRELEFDFIGQWKVHEGQHFRVRPLRLYVKSTSVPKNSKKVGIAISAKTNAVWRNDNEGRSSDIFNTIVLKENLKHPNDKNTAWTKGLKFYNLTESKFKEIARTDANGLLVVERLIQVDENNKPLKFIRKDLNSNASWSDFPALQIIPYSEDDDPSRASASLEISVAEVGSGARKKVLKLSRKGLGTFKDDITSVLEEAASELLEDEAPVVNTPDKYCATFTSILSEDGTLDGSAEWTGGNETCDSNE